MFSDIYDMEFFNEQMKEHFHGQPLMVPRNQQSNYRIEKRREHLWHYSEHQLRSQRKHNTMAHTCTMIRVMQALKLNPANEAIVNSYTGIETNNAIHIRIDQDWISWCRHTNATRTGIWTVDTILEMYAATWKPEEMHFTTGEKHRTIQRQCADSGIRSRFFYRTDLEYEINAAINFELCCRAKRFVGLTKSTFSNLITLKRSLMHTEESYIYNDSTFSLRVDKGLHCGPESATQNKVTIV